MLEKKPMLDMEVSGYENLMKLQVNDLGDTLGENTLWHVAGNRT